MRTWQHTDSYKHNHFYVHTKEYNEEQFARQAYIKSVTFIITKCMSLNVQLNYMCCFLYANMLFMIRACFIPSLQPLTASPSQTASFPVLSPIFITFFLHYSSNPVVFIPSSPSTLFYIKDSTNAHQNAERLLLSTLPSHQLTLSRSYSTPWREKKPHTHIHTVTTGGQHSWGCLSNAKQIAVVWHQKEKPISVQYVCETEMCVNSLC